MKTLLFESFLTLEISWAYPDILENISRAGPAYATPPYQLIAENDHNVWGGGTISWKFYIDSATSSYHLLNQGLFLWRKRSSKS